MSRLTFRPSGILVNTPDGTKILVAARKAPVDIRFGCASCRCGTCAVKVAGSGDLSQPRPEETALLKQMALPLDGTVRLACQARILSGDIEVDLDFQLQYDPDHGQDDEDEDEDDDEEDDEEDDDEEDEVES